MGDQASGYTAFYLLHACLLVCLFLMAFFRPVMRPRRSSSIRVGPRLARLLDVLFLVWTLLWTMLAQWALYNEIGWIEPGFWPLVSLAAAALRRFPSFWLMLVFYFFHYFFAFDGLMEGVIWSIPKSPHGDLVIVQERRMGNILHGYPAGINQMFGGYLCQCALVQENKLFWTYMGWEDWLFARPRLIAGANPGEMEIRLGTGKSIKIDSDRNYEIIPGDFFRAKSSLYVIGIKESQKDYQSILEKYIHVWPPTSTFPTPTTYHSLILYLVYPLFFLAYWFLPNFRARFSRSPRVHARHGILLFSAYLIFGIPGPVYWPLFLVTWAWAENQGKPVYYWAHFVLLLLWIPVLWGCAVFLTPEPWFCSYFTWVILPLGYAWVTSHPEVA